MQLFDQDTWKKSIQLQQRFSRFTRDRKFFANGPITFKHFNNVTILIVWTVALLKNLNVIGPFAKIVQFVCVQETLSLDNRLPIALVLVAAPEES